MSLSEKDVSSLAKGFSERTVANGRIVFDWAQDFRRISRAPSLDGIEAMPDFKAAIETAKQRAQIRKYNCWDSMKAIVVLAKPTHSVTILQWNSAREAVLRAGQISIQAARRVGETMLQAAGVAALNPKTPVP